MDLIARTVQVFPQVDVRLEAVGPSGKAKEAHHQRDQAAEVGVGGPCVLLYC